MLAIRNARAQPTQLAMPFFGLFLGADATVDSERLRLVHYSFALGTGL